MGIDPATPLRTRARPLQHPRAGHSPCDRRLPRRRGARHVTHNPASGRVMTNVGMRREGTLRRSVFARGGFQDMAMYAILRDEYDGSDHSR